MDSLVDRLFDTPQALTPDELAEWWCHENLDAIGRISLQATLDPPGTIYVLHPLQIVVFRTEAARQQYLHELRMRTQHDPARAIGQHWEDLMEQCYEQLRSLQQSVTFRHDMGAK